MTLPRKSILCVVLVATTHCCIGQTTATVATNRAGTNPPSTPPLPPFTTTKCPVEFFRELLFKDIRERSQMMAGRNPETRKRIMAKVREYESMKPDQRELRLRLTEVHWYMIPLMSLAPGNRPPNLDYIPEASRKLVQDRLQEWDKLAPAAQNQLLTNQAAIQHFVELQGLTEDQIRRVEESLTPQRRERLMHGITEIQAMPLAERQKILSGFKKFFELTPGEQEKALTQLSEQERRQMEKTLQSLQSLTSEQRAQCIRSFDKFVSMTLGERQLFLKNADRWKLMKPEERQRWRELVEQMPLMPPNLDTPPMPPRVQPQRTSSKAVVVTNTN